MAYAAHETLDLDFGLEMASDVALYVKIASERVKRSSRKPSLGTIG